MRVLHVVSGLAIRRGGEARACAELCESLAAHGVEIDLAFFAEPGEEEFHPEGVLLHRFENAGGGLRRMLAYTPEMGKFLDACIPRCDLLHIHGVWRYLGFAAARVAARHSVPFIVQPHGSLSPWKLRHKKFRKWIYGKAFEHWVLRHARALDAESEEDRRQILDYVPGAKVFVVPCGAYPSRFEASAPSDEAFMRWPALRGHRIILFLSRLDVNKGIDLLLHSFSKLGEARKGWRLLMAGPDYAGTRARMEVLAQRLGIADDVFWAGTLSEDDRLLALRSCDFLVLPSLSENFGLVILEALFSGRPVITSTETPWKALDEVGGGRTVAPATEDLVAALKQFVTLPRTALDAMGQKGRIFARGQFDWASVALRVKEEYERLTGIRD